METEILTQLIKIAGSQKKLAIKSNVPEQRISEWKNSVHSPKLSKLCEMAKNLGKEIEFKIIGKN